MKKKIFYGKYLFYFSLIFPLLLSCKNSDINYNNYKTFSANFKKVHSTKKYLPEDGWYSIKHNSSWDEIYYTYDPFRFKSHLKEYYFVGHIKFIEYNNGFYCEVDAFESHYSYLAWSYYRYFEKVDTYFDGSRAFKKNHYYDIEKVKDIAITYGNDNLFGTIKLFLGLFDDYNNLDNIKNDLCDYIFDSPYSFTHIAEKPTYDSLRYIVTNSYLFSENYSLIKMKRKNELYIYSRVETIELTKLDQPPIISVPTIYEEELSLIESMVFVNSIDRTYFFRNIEF